MSKSKPRSNNDLINETDTRTSTSLANSLRIDDQVNQRGHSG